jgi:3-methyladenine DNA glycosylase AlkD
MSQINVTTIQKRVRQLGNQEIAEHSQGFFKTGKGEYGEGDRFLGIRVPVLRKLATQYREAPLETISELLSSAFHEERLLALLILVLKFARGTEKQQSMIYQLYLKNTHFINSWDLVDSSAQYIVGAYLLTRKRAPLYRLARSNVLWERRIAIMATFYFIKKKDFEETLKISELLIKDAEDLIHKAVGWMLREVGKRDPELAESFLRKNYQKMPRTMLRYAIEKLPKSERQAYMTGRI